MFSRGLLPCLLGEMRTPEFSLAKVCRPQWRKYRKSTVCLLEIGEGRTGPKEAPLPCSLVMIQLPGPQEAQSPELSVAQTKPAFLRRGQSKLLLRRTYLQHPETEQPRTPFFLDSQVPFSSPVQLTVL